MLLRRRAPQAEVFSPTVLRFDDMIFLLEQKLPCDTIFSGEGCVIANRELGIHVWGETREEAERAFSYQFYMLYHRYYSRENDELNDKGKRIKKQMERLVKHIFMEVG
jgi:hypothetical protein